MKRVLLFNFVYCSLFVLFFLTPILSQDDPFGVNQTGPRKVKSQDVFLLWMENAGFTNARCYQKVYGFKLSETNLPPDSLITKAPSHEDNRLGGGPWTDLATGKFSVSPYDQVVSIWGGINPSLINIMIPHPDTTEAMWTNSTQESIGGDIQNDRMYVRTLDIDGDSLDEFLVAYLDNEDSVHFKLYDVDSTLQPTLIASFSDEKLIGEFNYQFLRYYIETGDFNGDGTEELALLAIKSPLSTVLFAIKVKIYDFEGTAIIPKGETEVWVPWSTPLLEVVMGATVGNFKTDEKKELAITAVRNSNGNWKSYSFLLETSPDLMTIYQSNIYLDLTPSVEGFYQHLSIASGDLNNDGRDEVVFTTKKNIYVLATDDNLDLTLKLDFQITSGGNYDIKQIGNFLKVSDVNQDGRKEIVIVKNFVQNNQQPDGFYIAMYSMNNELNQEVLLGRLFGDENQYTGERPYSIAVGNFDGFDFTVGTPSLYHDYGIVQPVVLLNAPPVHFDMFNGIPYDINGCYNGGDCDFWALYKKQTTTSIELSVEIHNDWAISAGVREEGEISATPMGVGVSLGYKFWAVGSYGEHFSKDSSNRQIVSISVEVEAREDDRIYSTISDYDIWEYPVFHGNESISRRSYFAIVPKNVQATWYGSKSYFAQQYVPDHEVSNILSYYPYDTLSNNPNLSNVIRASYVSDRFSLDGSSDYNWNLTITDFQQSGAVTQRDLGFDAGAELGGFSTTFKFANKKMTTHKTSVEDIIDLQVNLGSVNMGIGDVKYAVTPYAYWGKNDALVVDYAVQPELAPPGFPPTWWQTTYGNNSDPTFVLPWRLDPEKGFSLNEQAKRFQTKDITFSPKKPEPGDTLTISARVRNFSLMATPSPVSVKFYIGDPDSGGTPIIGVNGTNTVSTNGVISAQGRSDVSLKWVVPSSLPQFPRIYAVLDQEGAITEIHENNNKGFNVLGASSVSGVEDERYIIPDEFVLYQSYPNPFNPSTTIKYSVPISEVVSLKVYDILGREVAVLFDEYKTAGTYSIDFNASKFASGVYFYQIRSGNFVETKKMVLMK